MKITLSIVLLSALVLTATAGPLTDVTAFLDGFTKGMNRTDPAIGSCQVAAKNASETYAIAMELIEELEDGDAIEQAVGNFGFQIAHAIRVCGGAYQDMGAFLGEITEDLMQIDATGVYNRLFANMFALNLKFQAAKAAHAQGDMKTVGEIVAEVYKMILLGEDSTRTIRQLAMFATLTQKTATNFNATYLGFLGFIEEANTTIDVNHYLTFSNDTSAMIAMTATLEAAIQKMDISTIFTVLQNLNSAFQTLAVDFRALSGDVTAFVQRDISLFNSAAQIQKIGSYLFANIPTTMMNMQRITNAYKSADFREAGHGTGALYNQIRDGAMSSF